MSRLLLCTDLDRTLLPNGADPESPGVREVFARLAAHPGVVTVYVTGRDPERVDRAIGEYSLPTPDLLVADVGSTVACRTPKGWRRDPEWDAILARDWSGRGPDDLAPLLADLPELAPQEASRQGRFKLSYFAPSDAGARLTSAVRARLDENGVAATIIWSRDPLRDEGLLDVLPVSADKAQAIAFVARQRAFDEGEVLFAGDSGNDLAVLASSFPSVLVANADPQVRRSALEAVRAAGRPETLYCARGGTMGWNGNYAAGILEGVLHFHPAWREWIEAES